MQRNFRIQMKDLSEKIKKRIQALDNSRRNKILKFLTRELEVGRTPSDEEIENILRYLEQPESHGELEQISGIKTIKEEKPKEVPFGSLLKKWNCMVCKFQNTGKCTHSNSPMFQSAVNAMTVCGFLEMRSGDST